MESEIVDRDGKLFVLDPWQNHFSKPIKYRTCWPTGILTSQYKHLYLHPDKFEPELMYLRWEKVQDERNGRGDPRR